jgi:hypothetical protein
MTSQSGTWRFGGAAMIACCILVGLLGRAPCQGATTEAGASTALYTVRENPGLMSVDYIIIGVTSAAVAGSLTLLIVVIILNRKEQKDKNKVIPSSAALEVRPDEENAIISKSMTAAEDGPMDDDPMG